jgi:hypothetical protein
LNDELKSLREHIAQMDFVSMKTGPAIYEFLHQLMSFYKQFGNALPPNQQKTLIAMIRVLEWTLGGVGEGAAWIEQMRREWLMHVEGFQDDNC